MKRSLKAAVASGALVAALMVTAGASSFDHCADTLHDLGLFQGTESGYALDRAPTRAEAATMLVRLLGAEEEALQLEYTAPFTDLQGWEAPYVQYLYENGLTSGMTETTFAPKRECADKMYTTFLLRALGYSDTEGDFAYNDAVTYAQTIGLADLGNMSGSGFLRDNVVALSYTALNTGMKGDAETTLLDKLVADGAVDAAKAATVQQSFDLYEAYMAEVADVQQETAMDVDVKMNASMTVDGQPAASIAMPMNMKSKIDMEDMDKSFIAMAGIAKLAFDESMLSEEINIELPIEYYFQDGTIYLKALYEEEELKIKLPLSMNAMLSKIDTINSMNNKAGFPVSMLNSISKTGETYTIEYQPSALSSMVNSILSQMGIDVSSSITEYSIKQVVTNGMTDTMDMNAKISVSIAEQTIVMDMNANYKYNDFGDSVQITMPTDLDTYVDYEAILESVNQVISNQTSAV